MMVHNDLQVNVLKLNASTGVMFGFFMLPAISLLYD